MDVPETHYAKTPDGLSIAYQTLGDGPVDVAFVPYLACLDVMWEEPRLAYLLRRLAKIGRLICFDRRGFGASDPVPLGALPTPEVWMEDLRVVLDAASSQMVSVIGQAHVGYIGMLFAASYPERTKALVLADSAARWLRGDGYEFGVAPEQFEATLQRLQPLYGTGAVSAAVAPSRAGDEVFRRWFARWERGAGSQATLAATARWVYTLDMRAVLSAIRVPVLVLQPASNPTFLVDHGRYLADHIAGSRLVVYPGSDSFIFSEAADDVLDEIEEFITGIRPRRESDRALATVLFTDFVASTEHAARLGDKRWTQVLDQHDALVRRELDRHRGRKVNTTGDGVLATFDGPARAVRCALAICAAVQPLGIEVRAGLHTGEVELRGDDIGGIAVHIGQRVSALARPGEVLVSSTVKDLVAGSGIVFADRGTHALKGVPDEWRLFAVES